MDSTKNSLSGIHKIVNTNLNARVYNLCFEKAIKEPEFEVKLNNCMNNFKTLISEVYYLYNLNKN